MVKEDKEDHLNIYKIVIIIVIKEVFRNGRDGKNIRNDYKKKINVQKEINEKKEGEVY